MDWLTFTSSIIAAVLSWPVAILAIVYILRGPLKELIRSLENLVVKGGGWEISLQRQLDEARQEAEEAGLPQLQQEYERAAHGIDTDEFDWLYKLAETYPRSAIVEAWVLVEHETRELARKKDDPVIRGRASTIRVLETLAKRHDIVPSGLVSIARELNSLRNVVVHSVDAPVTTDQATEYVNLALRLVSYLRSQQG